MEPEMKFAIIKLCFMGATFPRIMGEGLDIVALLPTEI